MTGTINPTIPTIGQPNSTEDVDVKTSLETLRDAINATLNASNEVDGAKIASATILDASLKSPNNPAYRNILTGNSGLSSTLAAGTYLLTTSQNAPIKSGSTASGGSFSYIYFDDADYVVTGKTLKMRLRAQLAVNATKPTLKFTFGLYPFTIAGGAGESVATLGTVVSGSTVEINEPAASTVAQAVSSDFTIPADGAYMLGVVTSAINISGNYTQAMAQLQVRNV